ncbi:glucosyltransferase domain-containing protein [Pyxidicoccus trucidator]|uniref:glucosyltransferase domain-containing protein n=1 Tax=Pyxidicoccus trucidator TaxID=2709662 RepID=UPI0013DCAC02|nr:glucosyltransferase domain-containing protein [Pyxidicoccus trucidator]
MALLGSPSLEVSLLTRNTTRAIGVTGTAVLLFLLPWVIYGGAITQRYGLRDDYAILREAREEPGKIFRVCAAMGRPLYGWLLEVSTRAAVDIDGLSGLRMLAVLGLGLLGASVFLLLRREGWRATPAALLATLLTVTPSAQVVATWSICWPQAVALVLGVAAFALARRGLDAPSRGGWQGVAWCLGGVVAMAAATLIYQVSGLFYAVLLAAALVVREDTDLRAPARWMARHLFVMGSGLGVAYVLTKLSFALGYFTPSPRMVFEKHLVDKAGWFLAHVLPNVLALSALNDTDAGPPGGYWPMVVLTLTVVTLGLLVEGLRAGRVGAAKWLIGLVVLSAAAYSVSFLAGERWPTYRTLYALGGVWSVFFAASLLKLGSCWPTRGPRVATALLGVFVAVSAVLAHQQAWELFALPQGRELAVMEQGASQLGPGLRPRVFVLTARQRDTSAPHRYLDEFGSVSVDAEWVAREMLEAVLRERFPRERDVSQLYHLAAASTLFTPAYDVLIDMRGRQAGPSLPSPPPAEHTRRP